MIFSHSTHQNFCKVLADRLFFDRLAQQLFELSAFIRPARAQKQLFALKFLESQNDLSEWENPQLHEETTEEITEKIPDNSLNLKSYFSENHTKIPENPAIKSKKTQQTLTLDSAPTPVPISIKTNGLKKNLNHAPDLINSKDFFKKNTLSKNADTATHLEDSQTNPQHPTLQRPSPKSSVDVKALENNVLSAAKVKKKPSFIQKEDPQTNPQHPTLQRPSPKSSVDAKALENNVLSAANVEKKPSFVPKKEIRFVKTFSIKTPKELKNNVKKSEEIQQHAHSNPLKKPKILSKSFETHTKFPKDKDDEWQQNSKRHSTLEKSQAFYTNSLKDITNFRATSHNAHEESPDDSKKIENALIQAMIPTLQKKIHPTAFKAQYKKKFVQNKIDPLRDIFNDFKIKIQIDCIQIEAKTKKSRVYPKLNSTGSNPSKMKPVSLIDYLTQPRRSSS